jgi:hypothetical protein
MAMCIEKDKKMGWIGHPVVIKDGRHNKEKVKQIFRSIFPFFGSKLMDLYFKNNRKL